MFAGLFRIFIHKGLVPRIKKKMYSFISFSDLSAYGANFAEYGYASQDIFKMIKYVISREIMTVSYFGDVTGTKPSLK